MPAEATDRPQVDEIDLGLMEFWERPPAEREKTFSVLREERPISRHQPPEDVLGVAVPDPRGYWALVRYDDVQTVSRNPDVFCSGQGVIFGDAPPEMLEASQSFLAMDAPRHTKLRGLVHQAFTPRQVKRIEDQIRANAKVIVDEAGPTGGGDFVELIAKRLPLMLFSEMVGVPEADREPVVQAADAIVNAADKEYLDGREPMQVVGEALIFLTQTATELAQHREKEPGDDLMTALVQAEVDGDKLTHAEIAAWFVLLSVAGNDTTRHTTTHGMRALADFPEQRAWLDEDLEGRMPSAVEEFVRWATPVQTFRRTATKDTELHGQPIEEGEKVVMFYGSANRDESVFDSPNQLDLSREPNRHVGFGGGGPHYCLGASLARTQLRTLFGEVLSRLPDIEVGEPAYLGSGFINGVKRMPASWTPTA
jgi:cytochrome P450